MTSDKKKLDLASASQTDALLRDLRHLITDAKHTAAVAVNASLTSLYWHIGKRIREEILGQARAEYGEFRPPKSSHGRIENEE